jgi:pimeloyl-ACP methyl ester carboxylesterase
MGNETSFKSFPAHVHNVLTVTLSESHLVHSKIYPRYRSRKPIEHARDDFSNWYLRVRSNSSWRMLTMCRLTPHESPDTDIVLLGHSLGGILAAEVALLQPYSPKSPDARLHRILGLIAFDTPFLGMHPGVIGTGISSLFRPKPEPGESTASSVSGMGSAGSPVDSLASSIFSQIPDDPNYNPPFPNDVRNAQRKGLEKALYFINKHSDGLTKATKEYVTSHFEFGGCMADYPGLKRRYTAVRSLEDVDELARRRDSQGRLLRRVRFVNYYSASTGRLKPSKTPTEAPATEMKDMSLHVDHLSEGMRSGTVTPTTPRLSIEEHRPDGNIIQKTLDNIDPMPMSENEEDGPAAQTLLTSEARGSDSESPQLHQLTTQEQERGPSRPVKEHREEDDDLPPIPPMPRQPPEFDSSKYTDPDHLKLAQKDHARLVKAYERAKKDRDKSINEREKLVRKREKAAKKEADKFAKATAANQSVDEREKLKRSATLNPDVYDRQLARDAEDRKSGASTEGDIQKIKKQRDRKFCTLPPKDRRTGLRDPTWIRVYMEGVDEVVAHTTLFIAEGETYERLVGDTAERIEGWIKEEQGLRAALQSDDDRHA